MDIKAFRSQHPEYDDLTDEGLTKALHSKFYSDIDYQEFARKFSGVPQQDPKARMYEGRARDARKRSPVMTGIRDTATRLVEWTPIGSWFDEAMASASSVLPASLGGQSYDDAKGFLDADRRIRDAESTKVGSLPIIGDVTVGGLNKLAGGVASAPMTPVLGMMRGGTLLPRVGNMAATGVGYGALYGAGDGNTSAERAGNAAVGAAIGGGIGAAAPLAARGIGNMAGMVRGRMEAMPAQLAGRSRSSVDRVVDIMGMDQQTPTRAGNAARALGPEGMLADVGENLTTATEGLAQQPGPARDIITGALNARAGGAAGRITSALDDAIGLPADVPSSIEQMRRQANEAARPFYQQFNSTEIPVDAELVSLLQAVPENVWPRVRTLMQAERIDPAQAINTGRGIDLIKRALDDAARSAGRGTNEERVYSSLARGIRTHVDNLLSPGDPADSPWARARQIVGEERGVEEALQDGVGVFRAGGRAPEQVLADMAGLSNLEQEAYRAGARSGLRNMMGQAATNFRANGDRRARRALNSDFARQNIDIIAGDNAPRITQSIDRENAFARTADQVMGNSATARRQATRDMIPRQYDGASFRELRGSSLSGLAMEGVGRIVNSLTANALNTRNRQIAQDMAEMLISSGVGRDEIVRGLTAYARNAGVARQSADAMTDLAQRLLMGTTAPAVSQTRGGMPGGM